jgi:hypothetical protein
VSVKAPKDGEIRELTPPDLEVEVSIPGTLVPRAQGAVPPGMNLAGLLLALLKNHIGQTELSRDVENYRRARAEELNRDLKL